MEVVAKRHASAHHHDPPVASTTNPRAFFERLCQGVVNAFMFEVCPCTRHGANVSFPHGRCVCPRRGGGVEGAGCGCQIGGGHVAPIARWGRHWVVFGLATCSEEDGGDVHGGHARCLRQIPALDARPRHGTLSRCRAGGGARHRGRGGRVVLPGLQRALTRGWAGGRRPRGLRQRQQHRGDDRPPPRARALRGRHAVRPHHGEHVRIDLPVAPGLGHGRGVGRQTSPRACIADSSPTREVSDFPRYSPPATTWPRPCSRRGWTTVGSTV